MRTINLLTISGSPLINSSTDFLLERIATAVANSIGTRAKIETDAVCLNLLKFIPCQACGKAPVKEFCFYDDLSKVYKLLAECDCLVFGSPIYFDSVSAQAKTFIDRCNCFRPPDFDNVDPEHDFIKRITRKRPGAMVLVCGEGGYTEGARRVIAGFFKWVEVEGQGMVVHQSPDFRYCRTVIEDNVAIAQADAIGKALAAKLLE